MNQRFVVVDLETTGHSPKNGDEIIEIGLIVIENREIIKEYSTKIKPHQQIPTFISQLTGIRDEDVKNSPSFNEVIPDILPLLQEGYFVAHHVQFDYEFLNQALIQHGYSALEVPILDTVELARMVYPMANSYKLEDITGYLNIEHYSPHRALSDAYVTGQLLLKILNQLEKLPKLTLKQLLPLTRMFKGDAEQIIEDLLIIKEHQTDNKQTLVIQNDFAVKKIGSTLIKEDSNDVLEIGNSFIEKIKKMTLVDLKHEQIEIIQNICDHFNLRKHTIIEAGMGVGKTLSYLLSAVYYAKSNDARVVISTSTIQLQQQIVNRDWPLITLGERSNFPIAILKSPSHYIHLIKLKKYLERLNELNYDSALSLAIIIVWLTQTETGDYDEIQLPTKGQDIWPYISGELNYNDDQRGSYFQIAYTRAEQASIIVVNHAFMVSERLYRTDRIPKFEYLIIDEAHRFEESVRKQLGKQIDYVGLAHLLNNLEKVTDYVLIEQLKQSTDQLFRKIYQAVWFLHSEKDALSDTGKIQFLVDEHDINVINQGDIQDQLNDFILLLENTINELNDNTNINSWTKTNFVKQLTEFREVFIQFFKVNQNFAKWIEIDQDGAKNAVQLNVEPINISHLIRDEIIHQQIPTAFLSGTIVSNDSFHGFLEELGLDQDTSCITVPSPYNFENQARIFIPSDFPDIKTTRTDEFTEHIADYVYTISIELKQRIIVLFTSFEMLKQVHDKLKRKDQNLTVLSQGIQTGSREKLKKLFEKTERGILLGTNSFWEGIDIQSNSVKMIIMVRLPFDTPNHPMLIAKSKFIEETKQKNAFYDYMLPHAILRFRQAFGRMIRNETDRGIMFILDQRIMTKSYGKKFIKSIPNVPVYFSHRNELIKNAKNWLSY